MLRPYLQAILREVEEVAARADGDGARLGQAREARAIVPAAIAIFIAVADLQVVPLAIINHRYVLLYTDWSTRSPFSLEGADDCETLRRDIPTRVG